MESIKATALGLAVRFAREDLRLTANDLAAQARMSVSSLSRSERGLRMLELDEAERVSHVLGITVSSLLEQAHQLEKAGVVRRHVAALENLSRALDEGRAAVVAAKEAAAGR